MKIIKHTRITYDAALAILILFLLCSVVFAAQSIGAGCYSREDFAPVTHTIRSGETPWQIASRYCPDTLDKRLYLEWCAKENGFTNWDIVYPGEEYIFLKLGGEKE